MKVKNDNEAPAKLLFTHSHHTPKTRGEKASLTEL